MPRKPAFPPYPKRPYRGGSARITVTHGPGSREQINLGSHGSAESWDRYREELGRWQARQQTGAPPQPTRVRTISDLVAAWLDHAEQRYSQRGREYEQHRLSVFPLVRLCGSLPVRDFDAGRLDQVRAAMLSGSWMTEEERAKYQQRGLPLGLCRNVANRRIVRIRTMWQWADVQRLVPAGSYHHLLALKGIRKGTRGVRHTARRRPATEEEVKAVLAFVQPAWKRRPVAAMLQLQWLTGCRSQDVRIMRDVDIDQAGVEVDGKRVWLYRPAIDKGDWREDSEDAPRVIPLGPEAQAVLREWLLPDEPAAYLFRPRGVRDRGQPYSAEHYAQCVRRAARRAGLPWFSPYCCRHGRKQLVKRLEGLDAARVVLGQKSAQTTELYGTADVQHAAEIAARLG